MGCNLGLKALEEDQLGSLGCNLGLKAWQRWKEPQQSLGHLELANQCLRLEVWQRPYQCLETLGPQVRPD